MKRYIIKNIIKNIYWGLYGISISNPELPEHVKSILFICKGNICRSVFSERIAEKYSNVSRKYKINSAGIRVEDPKHSPVEALIVSKHFGIDIEDHVSKQINYSMMESNDLIITMEAWQFEYLRNLFLEFRNKIFLLPLLINNKKKFFGNYSTYNIKDPYGKDLIEFNNCFKNIEYYIKVLFSMLNNCVQ